MAIETYLAVRARGLKLRLLPRSLIEELVETPSLAECIEKLAQAGYEVREASPDAFECAAALYVSRLVERMTVGTEGPPADLLKAYSIGRFEADMVRDAVRSLAGGARYSAPPCPELPGLRATPRLLSTLRDLREGVRELAQLGYRALRAAYGYYEELGTLSLLEMGVEADYYWRCWQLLRRVGGGGAKGLLEFDSASRWLYWLALLKAEGAEEEALKALSSYMVAGLSPSIVRRGVESDLRELADVARLVSKALGDAFVRGASDFMRLEVELYKSLYAYASRIFRLRPVDLSYAMACVLALYLEAKNVYRVLVAKLVGAPAEILRRSLLC